MSYLFGDSTPSTLQVNYIEFLRDAVDFCVQVMAADHRMAQGRRRVLSLEQATTAEAERLDKLEAVVAAALRGVPTGDQDSAMARCAGAIERAAGDLVRAEVVAIRAQLAGETAKLDGQTGRERDSSVMALETLLAKHDLPDTTLALHLALANGPRYACQARATTTYGLDAVLELEIPPDHLFGQVLRVERLFERLEVQAPEMGGWLHKEMKMRAHRLEKLHVAELAIGAGESLIKLRINADGTGGGYDITFRDEAPRVRLLRIGERDESGPPPFDVPDTDAEKLLPLYEKLAAAAADLKRHRKALVSAALDGQQLRSHDKPSLLVERLVAAMAPTVQEINTRSRSPGELVLRRQLSDDRREEIFLSKADLKRKLDPLPESMRALFEPLWAEGMAALRLEQTARRGGSGAYRAVRATPPLGSLPPRAEISTNTSPTSTASTASTASGPAVVPRASMPEPPAAVRPGPAVVTAANSKPLLGLRLPAAAAPTLTQPAVAPLASAPEAPRAEAVPRKSEAVPIPREDTPAPRS